MWRSEWESLIKNISKKLFVSIIQQGFEFSFNLKNVFVCFWALNQRWSNKRQKRCPSETWRLFLYQIEEQMQIIERPINRSRTVFKLCICVPNARRTFKRQSFCQSQFVHWNTCLHLFYIKQWKGIKIMRGLNNSSPKKEKS